MSLIYKAKAKTLSFFSDIRFYKGGIVLFGSSSYNVSGTDMRKVINNIQTGDVLLRRYSHYLGSVLIKGYFSHAAIYVGADNVIHMLGEGIDKEDILTFLRCDDICILRFKEREVIKDAVTNAYFYHQHGIDYDYDFNADCPERFYCTEFVDFCFDYPVKKNSKNKFIVPDDFLESKKFELVWRKE